MCRTRANLRGSTVVTRCHSTAGPPGPRRRAMAGSPGHPAGRAHPVSPLHAAPTDLGRGIDVPDGGRRDSTTSERRWHEWTIASACDLWPPVTPQIARSAAESRCPVARVVEVACIERQATAADAL